MLNHVILIGRLGRDPELRTTQSGQPIATFTVATNRGWTDRDGNRQEETEWNQIVCWGRQAEIAGQYLTRGQLVSVEGRLKTRSWDDQQTGQKRYRTEIICRNFQMLGGRGDTGGQSGYGRGQAAPPRSDSYDTRFDSGGRGDTGGQSGHDQSQAAPARSAPQDTGMDPGDVDDDIPF